MFALLLLRNEPARERFRVEGKGMKRWRWSCVTTLALAACSRTGERQAESNRAQAVPVVDEAQPTVPAPGTGPNARTPLGPVTPAIDARSTEAAEELVRAFVRLLSERKFDEAYALLGPIAPPRKDFDRQLLGYTHVTQGPAGNQEGAAGSIFLSVPLTFAEDGGRKRDATLILRRVNDVPGSTEAQRHWHIERIDWGAGT